MVPDRPAELARAMERLLDDDHERARMSAAARAHWESRFTWERAQAQLRDVVSGLG